MHSKSYVVFLYDDVHLMKIVKDIAKYTRDEDCAC